MPKVSFGPDGRPLDVDAATSIRLGRIRQKDTEPEQVVGKFLTACGLRYRRKNRDLPGSPDFANRTRKWAVFVHGCFWHSHAGCFKATVPKRNRDFWLAKFATNRKRDRRAVTALRRRGYVVLVVWECDAELRPEVVVRRLRRLHSEAHI